MTRAAARAKLTRVETKGLVAMIEAADAMVKAAAPMMAEESLFEYHLYSLARPTTLKENQTKQVALLAASSVTGAWGQVVSGVLTNAPLEVIDASASNAPLRFYRARQTP